MVPHELNLLRTPSDPTVSPDGKHVVFTLSTPDTESNSYQRSLWRIAVGDAQPHRLTWGDSDGTAQFSPDGTAIAFLRADDKKRPQLHLLASGGGDARPLTDQPLGVSEYEWSPDGERIAFVARLPEAGRYGTDEDISPEQEAPRHITTTTYLADGVGYILDRPSTIFVISIDGDELPTASALSPGPSNDTKVHWLDDGERIGFLSARDPDGTAIFEDNLRNSLCSIRADGTDLQARSFAGWAVEDYGQVPDHSLRLLATDIGESGTDFVAHNQQLCRIEDDQLVPIGDRQQHLGGRIVSADGVLLTREQRGRVVLECHHGNDVREVLGGDVSVAGYDAAGGTIAAVAATPTSPGELFVGTIDELTVRTDFAARLQEVAPAIVPEEITARSDDDYPVHGWLFRPVGNGPHPVILLIHGGPYAQYPATFFDEPQVYARAGYAVVMCNPRGGSGYGSDHGRVIKEALGDRDVADVMAFLEHCLSDPALDAQRVGVMGGSYGGLMTTWILGHTDRFAAGISERAVNAWDSMIGTSDIGFFFPREYVGSDMIGKSPLDHADQIATPLMIIHSERDYRCPLEQGQRLYGLLRARRVPTELLIFPGEGHELSRSGQPRHRLQRFEHILAWWTKYLPISVEVS